MRNWLVLILLSSATSQLSAQAGPSANTRPATTEPVASAPSTARTPASEPRVTLDLSLPRAQAALLQTALAREGFSPGLIDGKVGAKTRSALLAFQRARGLTASGTLDNATRDALALSDADSLLGTYRITSADFALITGPIPTDWNERARLPLNGYSNLEELLAERGWCSVEHVRFLNPSLDLSSLKPGDSLLLPTVNPVRIPTLEHIEIDLADKLVKGFDAGGQLVLFLHCSIAREVEKRPVGSLKVEVVAIDPDYTFNPASWPEVKNVTRRLRIAPGPRNPVGLAWVGLDRPGYGMHGTPRPQDIGKTGSHGCFRLANWDAVRLAKAVRIGTTVEVRE